MLRLTPHPLTNRLRQSCLFRGLFRYNIRDWIMAQLALDEMQTVDMPQVCLLFAIDAQG